MRHWQRQALSMPDGCQTIGCPKSLPAWVTVHIPRQPYVQALPGIPTIRPFEALACGIPLICSPWQDVEGLFTPGTDFLIARHGREMTRHRPCYMTKRWLRRWPRMGVRPSCSATPVPRVDELLDIWGRP